MYYFEHIFQFYFQSFKNFIYFNINLLNNSSLFFVTHNYTIFVLMFQSIHSYIFDFFLFFLESLHLLQNQSYRQILMLHQTLLVTFCHHLGLPNSFESCLNLAQSRSCRILACFVRLYRILCRLKFLSCKFLLFLILYQVILAM